MISAPVLNELLQIKESNHPMEACAILFKNNTIVKELHPKKRTVVSFDEIDPQEMFDLIKEYGEPSALFHTHPVGSEPSQKDLFFMKNISKIWNIPFLILGNDNELSAYMIKRMKVLNRSFFPIHKEEIIYKMIEVGVEVR